MLTTFANTIVQGILVNSALREPKKSITFHNQAQSKIHWDSCLYLLSIQGQRNSNTFHWQPFFSGVYIWLPGLIGHWAMTSPIITFCRALVHYLFMSQCYTLKLRQCWDNCYSPPKHQYLDAWTPSSKCRDEIWLTFPLQFSPQIAETLPDVKHLVQAPGKAAPVCVRIYSSYKLHLN